MSRSDHLDRLALAIEPGETGRPAQPRTDCTHEGTPDVPWYEWHKRLCPTCGLVCTECPVCAPITYAKCAGCHGSGIVTIDDAALIRRTL